MSCCGKASKEKKTKTIIIEITFIEREELGKGQGKYKERGKLSHLSHG